METRVVRDQGLCKTERWRQGCTGQKDGVKDAWDRKMDRKNYMETKVHGTERWRQGCMGQKDGDKGCARQKDGDKDARGRNHRSRTYSSPEDSCWGTAMPSDKLPLNLSSDRSLEERRLRSLSRSRFLSNCQSPLRSLSRESYQDLPPKLLCKNMESKPRLPNVLFPIPVTPSPTWLLLHLQKSQDQTIKFAVILMDKQPVQRHQQCHHVFMNMSVWHSRTRFNTCASSASLSREILE